MDLSRISGLILLLCTATACAQTEWGLRVMTDWATVGQCTQPKLVGKCGAQVAVLDLNQPPNGEWPGALGHVDLYEAKTGSPGQDGSMFPFGKHSMYELGSTTKAYSTTLLQILIDKGLMSWNETIADYFPQLPFVDQRIANVTLALLSTHRSGLPARPWTLPSTNDAFEPYANFTMAELLQFLRDLSYDHAEATPQGAFIYCNDGFGLLGVMMELRTNKTYEALLEEHIFGPLVQNETSVDRLTALWHESGLVPLNASRMSPGHDRYHGLVTIRRQPYGVYKANGALKSTAQDMVLWLQAALLGFETPNETETVRAYRRRMTPEQRAVSAALREVTAPEVDDCPTPPLAYAKLNTRGRIGRAWQNYWSGLRRIVWKSGNTRGFATMKAFDWALRKAVWAFDTCGGCDENKLDKVAMLMLNGPATKPPAPHAPVIDLERFVGVYYINRCSSQDVDLSALYKCGAHHSGYKCGMELHATLERYVNVSLDGGKLMLRRSEWSSAHGFVELSAFAMSPGPSYAELYPARSDTLGFRFTSPERDGWINSEHKNKGWQPFVGNDHRLAAQEVYFLYEHDPNAKVPDTLVLHSGGIDNFAVRDKSSLPLAVCGVGSSHWNGLCRDGPWPRR